MKIKTKKQLNLPQLIEWAWDNPELSQYKMFEKIGATMRDYVSFNNEKNGVRLNGTVKPTDLFTVEVEEEITEDTRLDKLVERWKHDDEGNEAFRYVEHDDKSINKVLFVNPESVEATHFYAEIDGELELIWRDGKLVE
ncbi:hypothetical protein [Staphylococcus gallinarum]|uniref:hypothetical protein n=1 Tax=Staphylococcus gallinarum TaxID=1293 RepID=UPI000D1DEDD3|nr:hypothetical protein [Staphylococcus gallinarum]PTK95464.1 hypothetical protein BUZ05_02910 [Staphylococcus gallinarum]PTK96389.1 hypothetical protein BUZ13_01175 [Staphylococcus gallinarum]